MLSSKTLLFFGVLAMLGLLITSCSSFQDSFPYEIMLKTQDLPKGWIRNDVSTKKEENAETRIFSFTYPKNTLVGVGHELTIYTNEKLASDEYLRQLGKEIFPTKEYKTPSQFGFTPINSQDQFSIACISYHLNNQPATTCNSIQRHRNILSQFTFNIDGHDLTLKDVEQILTSLDKRLPIDASK